MIEKHLRAFLVKAYKSLFIAYDEVEAFKAHLLVPGRLLRLHLLDVCEQAWHGRKEYGVAFCPCQHFGYTFNYDLHTQIGYTDIKAYLWYILDEIVVEA